MANIVHIAGKFTSLTILSVLHEALHTFIHADTGLLYTLKNLAIRRVLRKKLPGRRTKNQSKTFFSIFYLCRHCSVALHFVNATSQGAADHFDIEGKFL
jgi:hypothetical protein